MRFVCQRSAFKCQAIMDIFSAHNWLGTGWIRQQYSQTPGLSVCPSGCMFVCGDVTLAEAFGLATLQVLLFWATRCRKLRAWSSASRAISTRCRWRSLGPISIAQANGCNVTALAGLSTVAVCLYAHVCVYVCVCVCVCVWRSDLLMNGYITSNNNTRLSWLILSPFAYLLCQRQVIDNNNNNNNNNNSRQRHKQQRCVGHSL